MTQIPDQVATEASASGTAQSVYLPAIDKARLNPFPPSAALLEAIEKDTLGRLSEIPVGFLLQVIKRKILRRLKMPSRQHGRLVFTTGGLVVGGDTEALVRTYLHHQFLRAMLSGLLGGKKFKKAADFGCGWGRMSLALSEFSEETYGFEREPHFVLMAQALIPGIHFQNVATLDQVAAEPNSLDFAMIFTVLQHMGDPNTQRVVGEMKRTVGEGYIMIGEKTIPPGTEDPGDPGYDEAVFYSRARPITLFQEWMRPWTLEQTLTRDLDTSYNPSGKFATTYMLFKSP